MDELNSSPPLDGTIVEPSVVDRTVAFFVALNDDTVNKSWSDFGKAALALGPVVFLLKLALCIFFYIWLRATWPRLRFDRLMSFGWKWLFPASVINLLVTAALVLYFNA